MSTLDGFKKVMSELRGGHFRPVYLLHGEEPFFIDRIAGELEHCVVEEHARDFDMTVVYGRDTDTDGVRDTCLRYPMMGERQLVVLREAQSWRIDQLEKLEPYVQKPMPSTVLVIATSTKKVDGRKSIIKTITKSGGVVFTSDKLREEHLPAWVQKYVAHMGRKIGTTEARLLADHLGSDLGKVTMEVEKLCLVTGPGATITADTVQRYVGISKDYNTFELQNAIGARDRAKALRIARYFGQDAKDHPFQVTMAVLNIYVTKLVLAHTLRGRSAQEMASAMKVPPFFLKDYQNAAGRYTLNSLLDAQHLLREYDMRSKGVGSNEGPGELLTELLARLMDAPAS